MPYYIDNPNLELTPEETQVKSNGYNFVSTTILAPGKGLNEHRHHSGNIHFIVQGSIQVKMYNHAGKYQAEVRRRGEWLNVQPNMDYMGMSGWRGCTFVEGHTELSPTTAKRFAGRERATLVEMSARTRGAYFVESEDEHETGGKDEVDSTPIEQPISPAVPSTNEGTEADRDQANPEASPKLINEHKQKYTQPSADENDVKPIDQPESPAAPSTNRAGQEQAQPRPSMNARPWVKNFSNISVCLLAALGPACVVAVARDYIRAV